VNKLPSVILVAVLFLALAAISLILVALPGLEGDIKGVLAFLAGTATLGLSSALAQLTKRDPLPPPALTFNLRFYTGALDRALAASEETVTKRIEAALQNQLADVEAGLADSPIRSGPFSSRQPWWLVLRNQRHPRALAQSNGRPVSILARLKSSVGLLATKESTRSSP
ncbi:MAG: hypothetical protein NTY23_13455, partial [Chloroflexi bacterium]|nr:hypothetical protein [Chloroflexota bacterium]